MEFWGVELKGDKPVKVVPGVKRVVHLLQATLAELNKGSDPVVLYVKIGDQKLAIGVLSADATPHLSFGLVFEKEFELSHNSKDGSVHVTGYKSLIPDEDKGVFRSYEDGFIPLEEKPSEIPPLAAAAMAEPAAKTEINLEKISMMRLAPLEINTGGVNKRPAPDHTVTSETKKMKACIPEETGGEGSIDSHIRALNPIRTLEPKRYPYVVTCWECNREFKSARGYDDHYRAKHEGN